MHALGAQRALLVDQAGDAPVRGHVDEHRRATGAQLRQAGAAEGLEFRARLLGQFPRGGGQRLQEGRLHQIAGEKQRGDSHRVVGAAHHRPHHMAALIQPSRQRQQDANPEHQRHAHDANLVAEHPEEEGRRSVQRKGHELLEGVHPGAGPRQEAGQAGNPGQHQNRQRHAQAEREENKHRHQPGLGEGETDGGAHEWRGAGRCDDGREHAGEERALVAFLHGQVVADPHQPGADLEHPGQAQAKGEEQIDDKGEKPGLLELKGPAHLLTRGPQGDQCRGEQDE